MPQYKKGIKLSPDVNIITYSMLNERFMIASFISKSLTQSDGYFLLDLFGLWLFDWSYVVFRRFIRFVVYMKIFVK